MSTIWKVSLRGRSTGSPVNREMRISLEWFLERAKIKLQVDIGFGDVIRPASVQIDYPCLLASDTILLPAYSWESVIAEKLHAIAAFKELSSRMKDFYDIHFLMTRRAFSATDLVAAITATFENRKTRIFEAQSIFVDSFVISREKQLQWRAYLYKIGTDEAVSFAELMVSIKVFILPVIAEPAAGKRVDRYWDPGGPWRNE